ELRPDLPARGGLNPCEIVPDGGIACVRWHRFQRATHEQWFLGGGCPRANSWCCDDCRCGTHERTAGHRRNHVSSPLLSWFADTRTRGSSAPEWIPSGGGWLSEIQVIQRMRPIADKMSPREYRVIVRLTRTPSGSPRPG